MSGLYHGTKIPNMPLMGTNIYATCRRRCGRTQEQWAEDLQLSVESVKRYETNVRVPSNYIVSQMVAISGDEQLALRHLLNTSAPLGVLPEVGNATLPRAAIQLINRVLRFVDAHRDRQLMLIAEDGKITGDESALFEEILDELQEIVSAAYQVRYCADEGEEVR